VTALSKGKSMKFDKTGKTLITVLIIALIPLLVVCSLYYINFNNNYNQSPPFEFLKHIFNKQISYDTSEWGTFGDFIGGILNPIYAFLAFAGVVYTVLLQREEIEVTKTEQKLDEIRQLILGLTAAIDRVLYEQTRKYHDKDLTVFNLLRSLSDDSLTKELDRNSPLSIIYEDTRVGVLNAIGNDLVYIEEQLSQIIWCLNAYYKANGSGDILDFYINKYHYIILMMKQINYLHINDLAIFFKIDELKKEVVAVIREKQSVASDV